MSTDNQTTIETLKKCFKREFNEKTLNLLKDIFTIDNSLKTYEKIIRIFQKDNEFFKSDQWNEYISCYGVVYGLTLKEEVNTSLGKYGLNSFYIKIADKVAQIDESQWYEINSAKTEIWPINWVEVEIWMLEDLLYEIEQESDWEDNDYGYEEEE
ncbi:hypothetical protein NPA08_04265 [Mycoplasmopsis citelli]|uniref:hypothetical protein n=1 Tax=Mycoplasmopsis citelli TaxID=171281 RepID=UPI0021141FBA|nr:hypothetical protein [Mycoplasmopsis citelli]UUD36134.1 hypothetical protein NPA08_04265 [Mycoplasmopsis citelli]